MRLLEGHLRVDDFGPSNAELVQVDRILTILNGMNEVLHSCTHENSAPG